LQKAVKDNRKTVDFLLRDSDNRAVTSPGDISLRTSAMRLSRTCILSLVALTVPCARGALSEDFGPIRLQSVSDWTSPIPKGSSANSFLLRRHAAEDTSDVPVIAVPWHTSYEDCTTVFYDRQLKPVGEWRESQGEQVMNATDGDLDGDGVPEILLTLRMRKPGVAILQYDRQDGQLRTLWEYRRDTTDRFHRGSAIGQFTSHAGREVVFGSSRGELILLDQHGELIANRVLDPKCVIQRIDLCDIDDDGYQEMVVATGRNPGRVWLVAWNSRTAEIDVRWQRTLTPGGAGGDNCYEAVFHAAGHPQGGPAIAAVTEQEHQPQAGSFVLLDLAGKIVWQDVLRAEDRRAGGCDFRDVTGDAAPEIVGRSTGPYKLLLYSNRGERIGAIANCRTGSAGPCVLPRAGKPSLLIATSEVYEILPSGE
jgi:hypothetical protein